MNENLITQLQQADIQPSYQRLLILDFLSTHPGHYSAEDVYHQLHEQTPTLSRATVYNTLKTFAEKALLSTLDIEENVVLYDIVLEPHGHFKCRQCNTIFNVNFNFDQLAVADLEKFQVEEKAVYFKGVCPTCLLKG